MVRLFYVGPTLVTCIFQFVGRTLARRGHFTFVKHWLYVGPTSIIVPFVGTTLTRRWKYTFVRYNRENTFKGETKTKTRMSIHNL